MDNAFTEQIHKKEDASRSSPNLALDHAWNWFKFHAEQRLVMVRFYLLIAGATIVGAAYANKEKEYTISILLCLFGALSAFAFMQLDRRTSDLIKLGEAALKREQERISIEFKTDEIRICERADSGTGQWLYSYKQNFRVLFISMIMLFLISAIMIST